MPKKRSAAKNVGAAKNAEKPDELAIYGKESNNILALANLAKVESEEQLATANNQLVILRKLMTEVEAKRKFYVQPLNESIKRINADFKRITDPLGQADQLLRNKVLDYRAELAKAAEAQRAKFLAQATKAQDAGKETKALALATKASEVAAPARTMLAGGTTIGTRKRWTFEVNDPDQVPPEYLIVDSAKVRSAVNSGIRSIPGVRIFQAEELAVGGR